MHPRREGMALGWSLLGTAMIVVALRDIVHELFHPELSGSISHLVARLLWGVTRRVGRHWRRSALRHAGPLILVSIGTIWVVLIAGGFSLIYLPRLPQDFDIGPGVPPEARHGLLTAWYVSCVMLTSVGSGDVTPVRDGVRLLASFEPMLGLVLISAWITWVLSIYPMIARRRAFEQEVDLLRQGAAQPETWLDDTPRAAVPATLGSLTTQVVRVGVDLGQSQITYFFQNGDPRYALATQLPYLLALGRAATASGQEPIVRHHGQRLCGAIEELLANIGARHLKLHHARPERVLDALARDHLIA